jgi:hypothetical protein
MIVNIAGTYLGRYVMGTWAPALGHEHLLSQKLQSGTIGLRSVVPGPYPDRAMDGPSFLSIITVVHKIYPQWIDVFAYYFRAKTYFIPPKVSKLYPRCVP